MAGFALIVLAVFPEGNEACQRCNQRTHATDIHAQQQIPVIVGELGQQDGGGHVADTLTGQHRHQ